MCDIENEASSTGEKKKQVFNKERLDKRCLAFFPIIYTQPEWTNEGEGTSVISFLPPFFPPIPFTVEAGESASRRN